MPPPGKRRAGPGTEGEGSGTCPHLPPPQMCSVRSTLSKLYFIPLGITGAVDEASSLAHCVIAARDCGSPDRVESDWMHETARCFGYPSDSTRTARELAREATRGHRRRRPGLVRPGLGLLLAPGQAASSLPRGSTLRCDAHRPCSSTPCCDDSRPCGSSLAGVGQRPLAIGHGCPVGLRAGVPDRRPVSPLSSPSVAVGRARAGAAGRGSPTAPCITGARRQSEPALSCARELGRHSVADRQHRAAAPVSVSPG